jgi:hypothetical protein
LRLSILGIFVNEVREIVMEKGSVVNKVNEMYNPGSWCWVSGNAETWKRSLGLG